MKLRVLELSSCEEIITLLNRCKSDIQQHPDYMRLFSEYTGQKAAYLLYGDENDFIMVPYFIRPLEEGYSDLVSPWYYGGPVCSSNDPGKMKELARGYTDALSQYCESSKIVSEFQRLHPLLKNHELYTENTFFDREIVYVDLRKSYDAIVSEYSRHTRKNLNKAERSSLIVKQDSRPEALAEFIRIYSASMDRKAAKPFYYFNQEFFSQLFSLLKKGALLLQVTLNGKAICSSIELGNGFILIDYLRGSEPEQFLLRPNDAVVDSVIRWAKESGYSYFILGGGNSNDPNDGILRFKKSFSATTASFYLYKKVHNKEMYKKLCKGREGLSFEQASFFPEYLKT